MIVVVARVSGCLYCAIHDLGLQWAKGASRGFARLSAEARYGYE